jgi:Uma2 family endonuclease
LISVGDDETVVVGEQPMERRMTVEEYLTGEETNRPQELTYGILREPAAPGFDHQLIVGRLYVRLDAHVRAHTLGRVVLSPIDVVLDPVRALVVQPDLAFVASARLDICRDSIWGAPDLVVEVLSTSNRRHDRSVKVGWYGRYGVRECWIVDPVTRTIEVVALSDPAVSDPAVSDPTASDPAAPEPASRPRLFDDDDLVMSAVLPTLRLRAGNAFAD